MVVRRRVLLAVLTGTLALAAAAPAHATLVFVKNIGSRTYSPSVWAAQDDGSKPKRLVYGTNPHISPDGTRVVYQSIGKAPDYRSSLRVIPATGGSSRVLLRRSDNPFDVHFSPDSSTIAVVTQATFTSPYRLELLTVATGARRVVDRGAFAGASFSPDGTKIVYSQTSSLRDAYQTGDLFIADVAGGPPIQVTDDHRSVYPLWGPARIVYAHLRRRKHDAPVFNLFLINPDGTANTRLTNDKIPTLVSGLTPTAWSQDGGALLTQFGGQDTSYAVAVDPATGAERVLGPKAELGYVATGLSRDGTTVLATSGGFDPSNRSDVITVPFTGGRPTILVRNATEAEWSR